MTPGRDAPARTAGRVPPALAAALAQARRVVVLTGAGVSAESGIPTFRDAMTGLWARFDPLDLATPDAFARHPRRVWDWYAERRAAVLAASPNAGHRALVDIEQRVPAFLIATQNVDGLHRRAGSAAVVELHGALSRVRCSREDRIVERWDEPLSRDEPPRCPQCGAWLRPDVVWFDEMLPAHALAQAEDASRSCDLMIVAGTSAEVHPAASLPLMAKAAGARLCEVNPGETPLSRLADFALRERAGIALPALVEASWPVAAHEDGRSSAPRADDGGGAK